MPNTVSLLDVVSSPWQSVLEQVRTQCNDYFGLTIFDEVGFEGVVDGYASLTVPNELCESWVNTHYGSILRKAFSSVYGSQFKDFRIKMVAPSQSIPEMKLTTPKAPLIPVPARPKAAAPRASRRPKLKLYPSFTFDNFVEGECNSIALKACRTVSENPGNPDLNPLFVYGASGLGKTHLLQSIAVNIQKNNPSVRVLYCDAFEFLRDSTAMAKALKLRTGNVRELAQAYQDKYEDCDVLLLDDVQLLEKGLVSQERLAILIRELRAHGKQVVLSCDRHPSTFTGVDSKTEVDANTKAGIPSISAKLLAPLQSCVAVGLEQPDLHTRLQLIQAKSVKIPFVQRDREEICRFLSIPPRQNIRIIEGILNWLGAMNQFCQENLDLNAVKRLMAPADSNQRVELTLKGIAEAVAFEFGTDLVALSSHRQDAGVSLPRKVAMYLCRELTTESLQNVGAIFKRDYATVIAAIKSLTKQLDVDQDLARKVQDIRYLLEA